MKTQTYVQSINKCESSKEFKNLVDIINKMPHGERIKLRNELEVMGEQRILRNLIYDYEKQTWID